MASLLKNKYPSSINKPLISPPSGGPPPFPNFLFKVSKLYTSPFFIPNITVKIESLYFVFPFQVMFPK